MLTQPAAWGSIAVVAGGRDLVQSRPMLSLRLAVAARLFKYWRAVETARQTGPWQQPRRNPSGRWWPRQSTSRNRAKPFSPSPASSSLTPLISPAKLRAFGPVSNTAVVPGSGLNDQLASAEGLIVPCSTI